MVEFSSCGVVDPMCPAVSELFGVGNIEITLNNINNHIH